MLGTYCCLWFEVSYCCMCMALEIPLEMLAYVLARPLFEMLQALARQPPHCHDYSSVLLPGSLLCGKDFNGFSTCQIRR
jgi:hypothetical protein